MAASASSAAKKAAKGSSRTPVNRTIVEFDKDQELHAYRENAFDSSF